MNLVDWAVQTINHFGGPGVAFLIALESVFPPIPSEVILPLAGVSAAGAEQSWAGMLIWSTIGSLIGALVLYGIGRLLGPDRLRKAFIKLPLLTVEDYDKTVSFMDQHGSKAVFFGRMVPGIRSLVSIPAGIYLMPVWKLTVLTVAGSGLWNVLFITFGYRLGQDWQVIEPYTNLISNIFYAIIGAMLLWWTVGLVRREHRRRKLGLPHPDGPNQNETNPDV